VGSSSQFLINKTRRSKFFAPSWHQHRLVRILAIEKTFSASIWLPRIPNFSG
jgi:hypothetical protein